MEDGPSTWICSAEDSANIFQFLIVHDVLPHRYLDKIWQKIIKSAFYNMVNKNARNTIKNVLFCQFLNTLTKLTIRMTKLKLHLMHPNLVFEESENLRQDDAILVLLSLRMCWKLFDWWRKPSLDQQSCSPRQNCNLQNLPFRCHPYFDTPLESLKVLYLPHYHHPLCHRFLACWIIT